MYRKLIATVMSVAVLAGISNAQNARVDAMGGYSLMEDHARILYNPVYTNNFSNTVQLTYDRGSATDSRVGPLFAIKSFGFLNFGLSYTGDRILGEHVYDHFINDVLGSASNLGNLEVAHIDPIPNILFGMDLNFLQIGARAYYERASLKYYERDQVGTDVTEINLKEKFVNMGIVGGMRLDLHPLVVTAKLGMGVPGLNASYEMQTSAGTHRVSASTSQGINLELGGEARISVAQTDLIGGLDMSTTGYSGKWEETPVGGPTTVHDNFNSYSITSTYVYGGAERNLAAHNMLLGAVLYAGMTSTTSEPDEVTYQNTKNTIRELSYGVNAGLEKTWDDLNRLDAIIGRMGLRTRTSMTVDRDKGESGADSYEDRYSSPASRTGFDLSLGLGVRKNMMQFDAVISPFALQNPFKLALGQLPSNDFAKFTMTLDFGATRSAQRTTQSTTTSTPSSTPSERPTFTPGERSW
ncbi:hypothetical protein CHISP_1686 [Chitinispirillum alkaliphilum]|nr:hypothetical protein CHISP_1686 [Chitinispirillum alkaliphilum]